MTKKISKKFIIMMSVFVSVVLLASWLIVSGTAKAIEYELYNLFHYREPEKFLLLEELKPGKYLLQRDWGLDETDYVEVFDDYTVQFFGDYWSDHDAELKAMAAEYSESEEMWGPYFSERNAYEMTKLGPTVCLAGTFVGFMYEGENTLEVTRTRDEVNDVTDFNHEPGEPDVPRRQEDFVIAHYIYAE